MATQIESRTLRLPPRVNRIGLTSAVLPIAFIVAITIGARLPFFFWPLSVDEGSYAYAAHWWFQGFTLYSADLWFDRPQAIFLAFRAGHVLLGDSTWAIRLWGSLWVAGTNAVLFLIARRLFDRRVALWGAVLFALFSAAPHIEGFTANAEAFMLLPATLSLYCLLDRRWAWAGLCASLALLLKPSGIVALPFAALWLLYERANWRAWLAFAVAALPLPLASVAHAVATVGFQPYFDAVIGYRLGVNVATGYHPENSVLTGWLLTSPAWGPLALPALLGLRQLPRRTLLFMAAWFATAVGGVAIGGHWIMHYFQQVFPPLAVLAGAGLVRLMQQRPALRLAGGAVLAIGLCAFLIIEGPFFVASPAQGMQALYHRPGYAVAERAAAAMRAQTSPDETIYVAFYEAEIYHLAQRRSSSIYLFRLDLLYLPGAYDSVVASIAAREPAYVLDLHQSLGDSLATAQFSRALDQGYRVVETFDGATLYRRR